MDIREELKEAYLSISQTDDESEDVVNFILSPSTLELLKGLYGVDMDKIGKMTCIMEKDEFLKALSTTDVEVKTK